MECCVSSASLAILVNGSPTDFFAIEKSLWLGDRLSPLLFNICANSLSCMLNLLLEEEIPCGFEVRDNLSINHIQFADDTLIFGENDDSQLSRISDALEAFLWVSSLKVNFYKTCKYGCNIPTRKSDRVGFLF